MVQQAEYTIKLPSFEGPFDLLFHLIKKAEVDIWTVSVADITDQYLAYLRSMQELNLDIASDFLVMAATLLRLKSKLLLPRPPSSSEQEDDHELFEINSAEELFRRLEEYRFFKEAAHYLRNREDQQQKIFLRSTGGRKVIVFTHQETVYTIWEGAYHLADIMLRFAEATRTDIYAPAINAVEDFIVTDKALFILTVLEEKSCAMSINDLIVDHKLWELIVTFIALLELARQCKVILLQEVAFGPILVKLNQ